ncbi:hypothetical protein RN629_06345 [Sphingomonadaceae bacterium jetA1]|jgi:hypothetical protein|uniref:hypothetical protein n=1 Tax=Facivitalis istanbulensis TaxID=3075838 RepID=UPI00348E9AF3
MRCAVLASAVLLAACGSSEKSATIGGSTFSTDESKGTASITTDKGTIRTAEGEAAAKVEMPAYAPRYPGATVTGVIETDAEGSKHKMVTLSTPDAIGKVADFYKASLTKAGWKIPASFISGDGGMLSGQKDGKEVSIAISRDEDAKTNLVVTFPNI